MSHLLLLLTFGFFATFCSLFLRRPVASTTSCALLAPHQHPSSLPPLVSSARIPKMMRIHRKTRRRGREWTRWRGRECSTRKVSGFTPGLLLSMAAGRPAGKISLASPRSEALKISPHDALENHLLTFGQLAPEILPASSMPSLSLTLR